VLLVDLRCHGESAAAAGGPASCGPHTVDAAARDVLELLRQRRMFPQMLIGHSFGGKVVMSMARQFGVSSLPRPVQVGAAAFVEKAGWKGPGDGRGRGGAQPGRVPSRRRPPNAERKPINPPTRRPSQVWVLDTLPGEVRAGGGVDGATDHPGNLIAALQSLPMPIPSRAALIDALTTRGFSLPVARWMTTNLRPHEAGGGALTWSFDLAGIADLYCSYESTCLWDLLQGPPQGLRVDFVRATRSTFRWEDGGAAERIEGLGHGVHAIEAGHWVHTENPAGLFEILAPTFGARDLHMQRSAVPFAR
jgi:pimeloyl-ACP methyl ester carboxylesterase